MTEPATLSALIDQRQYLVAAHGLALQIEAAVPMDSSATFWQGEASLRYQAALQQLVQAIISSRVWLENARTDSNQAIAEAENA